MKDFFKTQEIPEGQIFTGALFGLNGFNPFKEQKKLVIRIGLHRNGMVLLEQSDIKAVRLNAATAALFDNELEVERYCLHNLQLSPAYSLKEAHEKVTKWQ